MEIFSNPGEGKTNCLVVLQCLPFNWLGLCYLMCPPVGSSLQQLTHGYLKDTPSADSQGRHFTTCPGGRLQLTVCHTAWWNQSAAEWLAAVVSHSGRSLPICCHQLSQTCQGQRSVSSSLSSSSPLPDTSSSSPCNYSCHKPITAMEERYSKINHIMVTIWINPWISSRGKQLQVSGLEKMKWKINAVSELNGKEK